MQYVSHSFDLAALLINSQLRNRHVDDKMATSNFSFKCHRKEAGAAARGSSLVYAVNDISFHPFGTFSTAGADGTINLWDKDSKTRLKSMYIPTTRPLPFLTGLH
jgi:mRNA export factor